MLFNSVEFLLLFLPVTYLVFWALRNRTSRYIWLTLTGYFFYGVWNWKFCALMAFSTLVSFLAGIWMLRWDGQPRLRRLCLIVPVTLDLLLLGFFKYANLILGTAGQGVQWAGFTWSPPRLDIILPVGISFYTFHTISYMVDSYRRLIVPTRNLFEFSCYVSMFSQLVAGPIVRFGQIERDLDQLGSTKRSMFDNKGWSYFTMGMAQKVLIADLIASIIDPALLNTGNSPPCRCGLACWGIPTSFTSILPDTATWRSDWATYSGFTFPKTSTRPTRQTGSLISGAAGTSRCHPACGTISIFRLVAAAVQPGR